ncbi:hypothetical protein GCM10017600_63740 [Streptosporangium carneum]|uniref:Uncharacterized protein n=1 Tax=Streptosporangium carneum TaxID=47481 RepID=A0A9W6I8L6_9ACTN|nr:hypothetical protein GCM10017600_63740 [Streptosporangium carneum]
METGEGLARSIRRAGSRRRRARTRLLEVLVGVAALAVALLVLGGSLFRTGAPTQQQEVAQAVVPVPLAAAAEGGTEGNTALDAQTAPEKGKRGDEAKASGLSKHTDRKALAYFVGRKATKRLKDIRIVGGYLRIYTDLPESASNSKQALKLCETGRDYLIGELGEPHPVVFVQARFGENGNPVLANILGRGDSDCRLTYPKQGK